MSLQDLLASHSHCECLYIVVQVQSRFSYVFNYITMNTEHRNINERHN